MNTNAKPLRLPMDFSMTQQRSGSQAQAASNASGNPFAQALASKTFNLNVTAFKPSEFMPSMPFPTSIPSFTPSTASSCDHEEAMAYHDNEEIEEGPMKRYKTELCKNWIENSFCRYGKKCQFAHGHDELESGRAAAGFDDKLRTKNCRTFYREKVCNYGSRCMFRHEHRHIRQIHRHYYVAKLCAYETLF